MTSWFIKYRDRDSVVWRPSFLSTIRHSQGRVCVCVQGFSKGPDILFRVTSIWACMYNELLLNFFRSIAALEIILFFFYLIQKKEQKEKRLSTLTITLCIAPCVCVCNHLLLLYDPTALIANRVGCFCVSHFTHTGSHRHCNSNVYIPSKKDRVRFNRTQHAWNF